MPTGYKRHLMTKAEATFQFGKRFDLLMALSRLLNPTSIAFIGGNECAIAITRTRELGFTGKIYAVNPKRQELGGIPTVKSVDEIEGPIDAALVAVKREPTIDIVRALSNKSCGGAVIYAAGFAEAGAADLQDQLLAAANGMPLLGPNCYGFVNTLSRCALWPDEHGLEIRESGVAIITQSGNIACNFGMSRRALPLASLFAIGNQADVDIARMVEVLCTDDRITAIGLHIEGLKDIPAFARAAELARHHKKPIIALKTGRSEQGAKVTMSHTSSLSGADDLYDALFERHGIARMKSVTAFAETLKFLHHGGPIQNAHLVSMSCSGGEAALVADMALEKKVSFPPFNAATKPRVAATLNEFVTIDNPLDYHTFIWGDETKLEATFTATLSGGYDVGMLILDVPTHPHMNPAAWYKTSRAFTAAAKANKARAVIVASLPESMPLEMAAQLSADDITPMMGLDDALTAFEAAAFIGRSWTNSFYSHPDESRDLEILVQSENSWVPSFDGMTEYEGKKLLNNFGVTIPKGQLSTPADAVATANTLGYPVVVKISSATILHKTELGGVALNLRNAAEVEAAAMRMAALGDELLIEKMVQGSVAELIIGITRDQQFGLALVIGAGGIFTELLKDSVTLLLPCTDDEILRALKSLRIWTLIEGFRGKSGDQAATIDAIKSVCKFAEAYKDHIEELDINPLFVLQDGAVAADALIKFA
jgi:acetate---CoA ligase (ADP-forming)